jgi:hypothetical protein
MSMSKRSDSLEASSDSIGIIYDDVDEAIDDCTWDDISEADCRDLMASFDSVGDPYAEVSSEADNSQCRIPEGDGDVIVIGNTPESAKLIADDVAEIMEDMVIFDDAVKECRTFGTVTIVSSRQLTVIMDDVDEFNKRVREVL